MTNYTKLSVNFIALIISILLFFLINNFSIAGKENNLNINNSNQVSNIVLNTKEENKVNSNTVNNNIKENVTNQAKTTSTQQQNKDYEWQIEIPIISLKAEIKEGTSKEIMNKYVGHFTKTSIKDGNVGLAAHNRGYEVNYFQNLKKLKQDDKIIYKYKDYKKIYYVNKIKIIKDTDWTYLQNTEENVITLITCVENEPEYRRCIQAIERK